MFILDFLCWTHAHTNMYTTVLAQTPGHEGGGVGVWKGSGQQQGLKRPHLQYSTVSVLLTVLVLLPKPN